MREEIESVLLVLSKVRPESSVKSPPVVAKVSRLAVRPEAYNFPVVIAVEEAYGNTFAAVAVEVMTPEIPSVPVKLAAEEMVWPFMVPEVMLPVVRFVEKRLVDDAVVAKKLVVVAFVVVAFTPVKFWRVDELVARRFPRIPLVARKLVAKKLVVVAEVPVAFTKVKF